MLRKRGPLHSSPRHREPTSPRYFFLYLSLARSHAFFYFFVCFAIVTTRDARALIFIIRVFWNFSSSARYCFTVCHCCAEPCLHPGESRFCTEPSLRFAYARINARSYDSRGAPTTPQMRDSMTAAESLRALLIPPSFHAKRTIWQWLRELFLFCTSTLVSIHSSETDNRRRYRLYPGK